MIPQDQIIEWAQEAGFFVTTRYTKFAALVAQHQKEQDAQLALNAPIKTARQDQREACAAAIRNQE